MNSGNVRKFWNLVDIGEPSECWLWLGTVRGKYGCFYADGEKRAAHRVAFELTFGPINKPASILYVCHKCDNGKCCNPNHLFLGSHSDNMKDAGAKGRLNMQNGSPHKCARKLTAQQVDLARQQYESGKSIKSMAKSYGIDRKSMRKIVHRVTYRNVAQGLKLSQRRDEGVRERII